MSLRTRILVQEKVMMVPENQNPGPRHNYHGPRKLQSCIRIKCLWCQKKNNLGDQSHNHGPRENYHGFREQQYWISRKLTWFQRKRILDQENIIRVPENYNPGPKETDQDPKAPLY